MFQKFEDVTRKILPYLVYGSTALYVIGGIWGMVIGFYGIAVYSLQTLISMWAVLLFLAYIGCREEEKEKGITLKQAKKYMITALSLFSANVIIEIIKSFY